MPTNRGSVKMNRQAKRMGELKDNVLITGATSGIGIANCAWIQNYLKKNRKTV